MDWSTKCDQGADSTILQLVSKEHRDSKMMAEVERNLRLFAQQGLRTLCIATKVGQPSRPPAALPGTRRVHGTQTCIVTQGQRPILRKQ